MTKQNTHYDAGNFALCVRGMCTCLNIIPDIAKKNQTLLQTTIAVKVKRLKQSLGLALGAVFTFL